MALSILCPLLWVLLPCYTPYTGDTGELAGGHLLGQAPARPSGWARPQQRCPRQHWAPLKVSCLLDSLWAADGHRGGQGGRAGGQGRRCWAGHEREDRREPPVLGEGRVVPAAGSLYPEPSGAHTQAAEWRPTPTSLLLSPSRGQAVPHTAQHPLKSTRQNGSACSRQASSRVKQCGAFRAPRSLHCQDFHTCPAPAGAATSSWASPMASLSLPAPSH